MTTLPTIAQLYNNILSDLQSEFDITFNPFGKVLLQAIAGAVAGALYLIYLAIGMVQANIWVDTCDNDTLLRFGNSILGRAPFPASMAVYTASVTGTPEATISGTMVFKSDDTSESPGMLFQIQGGTYTMPLSGPGTITIKALAGGTASRLAIGNTLTATAPMINVNSVITVLTEVTTPIDAEDLELYRGKILEKIQLLAGGWSAVDYRLVGTEVNGVGQIYAYAASGLPNEVNVFVQGTVPLAYPGPSASPSVIAAYAAALEPDRPLGVFMVNYASSPINNIDITIAMGSFPLFNSSQKALIQTALTDFVNSVHPFIAACDTVAQRNDVIAVFNLSEAISQAVPGYGFSAVTFTVAGTPPSGYIWQADNGNISFLNSITYA